MRYSLTVCFVVGVFIFLPINDIQADSPLEGQELKGKHFIVYYDFKEDERAARQVLRKAEDYYTKLANKIGYSRHRHFWTWDERVKIVIFANKEAYVRKTGQPAWSRGYSAGHSSFLKSRAIVTYRQEKDFLDGLLPHEISHLILRDFLGFNTPVPIWFEEGVAQLEERRRKALANQFIRLLVRDQQYVPFKILFHWDIRTEDNPKKVTVFYSQSLTVVDFLITRYGSDAFGNLCRNLRDGKNFEDALRNAYPSAFGSVEEFERKWVKYMQR